MTRIAPMIRQRIFAAIVAAGAQGCTTDELECALCLSHQTCSPRVNELTAAGRIENVAGRTRPTRSGRPAKVYIVAAASTLKTDAVVTTRRKGPASCGAEDAADGQRRCG